MKNYDISPQMKSILNGEMIEANPSQGIIDGIRQITDGIHEEKSDAKKRERRRDTWMKVGVISSIITLLVTIATLIATLFCN